jgi:hypothetical protein
MLHLQEHYHYPFKAAVLVCDTKEMEEKMFVYDALPARPGCPSFKDEERYQERRKQKFFA